MKLGHAAFTILLLCLAVSSQTRSGSLSGRVTDTQGSLVPRARVTATRRPYKQMKAVKAVTETDSEGQFRFEALPVGVYKIGINYDESVIPNARIVTIRPRAVVKIAIEVGHGCDEFAISSRSIRAIDKAEIVRFTFLRAVDPKLGLLDQRQTQERLIVSTANIQANWLQNVSGLNLKLLSQHQIQREAEILGDFPYLSFSHITGSRRCIAVTVANIWASPKGAKRVYLSGASYRFEYRKSNGQWVGRFILGGVS